MVNRTGSSPQ